MDQIKKLKEIKNNLEKKSIVNSNQKKERERNVKRQKILGD